MTRQRRYYNMKAEETESIKKKSNRDQRSTEKKTYECMHAKKKKKSNEKARTFDQPIHILMQQQMYYENASFLRKIHKLTMIVGLREWLLYCRGLEISGRQNKIEGCLLNVAAALMEQTVLCPWCVYVCVYVDA